MLLFRSPDDLGAKEFTRALLAPVLVGKKGTEGTKMVYLVRKGKRLYVKCYLFVVR